MKRKKRSAGERHAELMKTDPLYRRLAERIEEGRTDAERAAAPLWSKEFSDEVTRMLEERIAYYEAKLGPAH